MGKKHFGPSSGLQPIDTTNIDKTRRRVASSTIAAAKRVPNNKTILADLQKLIQVETAKLQATSETTSGTLGEIESKHLSRLASAAAVLASADKKLNDNSELEKLDDAELEALAKQALQKT